MVQVSVNLLKNRRTLSEHDYIQEQKVLKSSVLALVVCVFVVIALSIWNYLLSNKLAGIESAIASSSRDMQGLTAANAQQIYLKSRLKLITAFLDDRSLSRQSLQTIFSLSIPGATITSAAFLTDNVIAIQVDSASITVLNDVVAYYQADSTFFTQVVSRGVTRTKDGGYELQLELTIPTSAAGGK